MNDFNDPHVDPHAPTPEFRASLEREIARELRRERQFEPAMRAQSGRRFLMVAGLAAGAIMMLTIGLVLGTSTGYASAMEASQPRVQRIPIDTAITESGRAPSALGMLKNLPAALSCVTPPPLQQGIPIVDLPAPSMKSTELFKGVLGVRQVSTGNILVNDAGRRRLNLLDSMLTLQSVVRDSAPGTPTSYGRFIKSMARYVGDSSLINDDNTETTLVLGASGQVGRVMAAPSEEMRLAISFGQAGVDDRGRIVYSAHARPDFTKMPVMNPGAPDSLALLRVDLGTRQMDSLGHVRGRDGIMMLGGRDGILRYTTDPSPLIDEWALLSDGSIAIVRGQDYHIDWIHADGTRHSTTKLPFDWKRLTDDDKQHLIDSTREVNDREMSNNLARRGAPPPSADGGSGASAGRRGAGDPGPVDPNAPKRRVQYMPPELKEMFDYYPPIRRAALMPDLEGNLWILPTSSAQSKQGELVYDVVNVKGDFHRVRMPVGRSLAGFGKGGVVYLLAGNATTGFALEKTKLRPPSS